MSGTLARCTSRVSARRTDKNVILCVGLLDAADAHPFEGRVTMLKRLSAVGRLLKLTWLFCDDWCGRGHMGGSCARLVVAAVVGRELGVAVGVLSSR